MTTTNRDSQRQPVDVARELVEVEHAHEVAVALAVTLSERAADLAAELAAPKTYDQTS